MPNWEPDSSFYDFSCQLIGGPRLTYKASQISHPVFRYIQRALAFTIFARGETVASMGESEIYFIYAMLNVHTRPEILPHVAAFMVEQPLGGADQRHSGRYDLLWWVCDSSCHLPWCHSCRWARSIES